MTDERKLGGCGAMILCSFLVISFVLLGIAMAADLRDWWSVAVPTAALAAGIAAVAIITRNIDG